MPRAFRLISLLTLTLAVLAVPMAPNAHAARSITYRAPGWKLTITGSTAPYGEVMSGTLTHAGKQYRMLGDWIPAGDAGSDLLRFYGVPFGTQQGLVSVAILFNTCTPYCAASRTYKLRTLWRWKLPGSNLTTLIVHYSPK